MASPSSPSSSSSSAHTLCDTEIDDRDVPDLQAERAEHDQTYYFHDDYDDDYETPHNDGYDDYDDICLVPLSPHKPKPRRNRRSPSITATPKKTPAVTKMIQPLLDSCEPSELPLEILEFVCSHLSQSTLRCGVSLVCRKWNEVSNRFIRRAGIWRPVDGVNEALIQQWAKFDTLECWFNMEPDLPVNYVPQNICRLWWDRFAAAVTAPTALGNKEGEARDTITTTAAIISNGSQVDPTTPPSCLLHSIRHLEFRGTIWGYTDAIPNLRGHLQFIETLTLEIRDSYGPVPLFKVLEDLPSLKSISIKFEYYSRVQLLHGDDDDHIIDPTEPWIDPETAHFPRKPWVIPLPKMFSDQYRLQRFDINGVVTHLRVLERVLVTCPELRVFKIKNIDINMYLRESSDDAEDNARQRLIDLATKHCPKLEWYAFHLLQHTATDDPDLATIGRCFPDQKFMSLTFGTYQESIPSTPMARDTLSRITVLEVKTCPWVTMESFTMNRVLCRAPNLLHLVAPNVHFSTNSLWQPPEPPQSEPPRYFATVRERKRHERSERRQIRQQALARFQSSSTTNNNNHNNNGSDQDDTTAPDANSSGPVTWQLYNLKTLDMSILGGGSMEQFTQYINQHRLFRNLVSFKLALLRLRIGQRETFADPKKPVTTATSSATPGSTIVVAGAGKRHPQVPLPPSEPARFPNDLLPLNTLRCLEEGILLPRDVPGLVLAKDFTFLQRKADFQTMSFLPTRRKSTEKSLTTTAAVETTHPTENHHPSTLRKKKNKIGADESVLSSDDDDDEEDEKDEEERLKTETFWPRLHTFHVYYTKMSPIVSASKLVSGMERIRPGVSFKFQTRSNA